ncbi:uncharacterized protein LOC119612993 [Lucilia sericata]|uniref:uncharacterized protein LOC119612993 n=1 Tax=Lucilia sericata TaxID=13632 RepID=UPI0018A8382A|nr:uncharacterized protein LOC119612993 [Lucilia sericata]
MSHNPYRFVVYALVIIMAVTIALDIMLFPLLWTTVLFYGLTSAVTIFRVFGRNGATIVIHIVTTLGLLLMVYIHFYDETHLSDVEYYREEKRLSYNMILDPKPKAPLPHRANFMAIWLTYPLFYLAFASITGILCIFNLSLNVRKMFAGLHGTLGHTITMIFFLVCVFYAHYFKTYDLTVTIKMLYYLTYMLVMLSPNLVNYSQILSKHFSDEPEEEEVEDDVEEVEEVIEKKEDKRKDRKK